MRSRMLATAPWSVLAATRASSIDMHGVEQGWICYSSFQNLEASTIMHVRILATPLAVCCTLRGQFSLLRGIGMLSLVKPGSAIQSLHDALNGQSTSRLCRISGPERSTRIVTRKAYKYACATLIDGLVWRSPLSPAQAWQSTPDY